MSTTTPTTAAKIRDAVTSALRDRDVANALALIGAPSDDQAADTYMPPRLRTVLAAVFQAGLNNRRPAVADLRNIQTAMHDQHGTPPPGYDARHEGADGAALRICRTVLAMSDPPPNRHVAYFTEQLRRAFSAAWDAGDTESGRYIEALRAGIADALQGLPEPHNPDQHALRRRAIAAAGASP